MRNESSAAISIRSAVSQSMRAISRFSNFHCRTNISTQRRRDAEKDIPQDSVFSASQRLCVEFPTSSYHRLMPEGSSLYCDVSLPVPLDQLFTYSLPETLRHRVRAGSRLVVPFGARKLTGVILRCHDEPPSVPTRDALRLIDSEPVLGGELLALGRWISSYYCAPLGEVLRSMLPLASEIRRGKIWSLTDSGRDAARQLLLETTPGDPVVEVLRMLEKRPLSAAYLAKTLPLADKAIKSLERK